MVDKFYRVIMMASSQNQFRKRQKNQLQERQENQLEERQEN